MFVLHLCRVV